MNTVGDNGYTVIKEKLTNAQITKIRKDLTVKPFVNTSFGVEAPAFAVYMESKRKLYLLGITELKNTDIQVILESIVVNL